MNAFAILPDVAEALTIAPTALVLVAKWTVLLALAWLIHLRLEGRNPRWRVALWRSAIVGVLLVAVLSGLPPLLEWRLAREERPQASVVATLDPLEAETIVKPRPPSVSEVRRATSAPTVGPRAASADGSPSSTVGLRSGEVAPRRDEVGVAKAGAGGGAIDSRKTWTRWLAPGLTTAWALGVLTLATRLALASVRLSRLIRRSEEAPEWVVRECRDIAGRMGIAREIRVRRSAEVGTPCLAGAWRPVLLLPGRQCREGERDDLEAILAHELAHARGHDLAWNDAAHLATLPLWFHPLAWRIRDAHASACDAVSDAVAADYLGDVASYCRTLARLALRVALPPSTRGLAMAHASEVLGRIETLNRKVFPAPLPRRPVMAALCSTSVLVVLIGGLAVTRAEPVEDTAKTSAPIATGVAAPDGPAPLPRERERTGPEVARELSGVVVFPDGRPAVGVDVAIATRDHQISVQNGRFLRHDHTAAIVKTKDDGRFTVIAPDDTFLLVTAGEAGYADAFSEEFEKSHRLVLQAWGSIEGQILIGKRPGAGQQVMFEPVRADRANVLYVYNHDQIKADDQGRFRFAAVMPGAGRVSRVVEHDQDGGRMMSSIGWATAVEAESGKTARVTVGGKGRPVVCQVALEGTTEYPINWRSNAPASIAPIRGERNDEPLVWTQYVGNIGADGKVQIDDVPPGRYELTIPVNAPNGSRSLIGEGRHKITVPDTPGDTPVDLGPITVTLFPTLKVGDEAPEFTVQQLAGPERIRLKDLAGKLVLLDFWMRWSSPSLEEIPNLKEIHEAFGKDPRFALVGLNCDQTPDVGAKYVAKNELTWIQGFGGYLGERLTQNYKVSAIPATFLIGPDGRILARNLRGPALKEAVQAALKDSALFARADKATRSPRFPITRFEVPDPTAKPATDPPAVAVLDDADEDFEAKGPHRDGLRLLDEAGKEIAYLREFNTCQTVGANHGVVIDAPRGRIYARELVGRRVTALDFRGRKLWQAAGIDADAMAIDPKTGHLWCSGGDSLDVGETVVLDAEGQEVTSFPVRGVDLAYDAHSEAFWLVGYGIRKVDRNGKILFQKPHEGWANVSVATDPRDGSVWIAERDHPDVARSANRLWHLDAQGAPIKTWELGKKDPFGVACDPKTGTAWVVGFRSEVLRFTPDGRELPPLPIKAVAIAISPTNGQVWVTTETRIVRIAPDGQTTARYLMRAPSHQSWLTAF